MKNHLPRDVVHSLSQVLFPNSHVQDHERAFPNRSAPGTGVTFVRTEHSMGMWRPMFDSAQGISDMHIRQ